MSSLGYTQLLKKQASAAGITLISSTSAVPVSDNTTSITSSGINTTGATLISVVVSYYAGSLGTPVLSDNKGNPAPTSVIDRNAGGNLRLIQYIFNVPSVGTGHTFSFNIGGAVCRPVLHITAWSGLNASPIDQSNGAGTPGLAINGQPGNILPTVNGCLLMTACTGVFLTGQPTISSGGWVNGDQYFWTPTQSSGNRNAQVAVYYRIQATAAATNPFHAYGGGSNNQSVCVISSLKPA